MAGRGPRVIAGEFGGMRLSAPRGDRTRPTSDRVKESLFGALGPRVVDARILDIYAGSGSLAIEAISRGAHSAVCVERDSNALKSIAINIESARIGDRLSVRGRAVEAYLGDSTGGAGADGPFDLVFADPPYETSNGVIGEHLRSIRSRGALASGGAVVIERSSGSEALVEPGWVVTWSRTYGDTLLMVLEPLQEPTE